MTKIGKNIISNLGLQGWLTVSQIILVPFYIHYLGVEAYGLVGLYTSLMAMFFLLDFGFSATIQQELAKDKSNLDQNFFRLDLLRTLEIVYAGLSLFGLVVLILCREFLSKRMASDSVLDATVIHQSILAMALLLALRLLMGLYTGAMNGLQQQYKLNIIILVLELIKFAGTILCLHYLWNHILAFFLINIFISLLTMVILRRLVWKHEHVDGYVPNFKFSVLRSRLKFTVGVALISIIAAIISQVDKFVLSGLVSLEDFGYYTLAFTIASIPMKFVASIAGAVYPRLIQEYANGNEEGLIKIYQKASQLISLVIVPVSLCLFFYTQQILNIWFDQPMLTQKIEWLVKIFVLGFMLNGMMTMPYYLQLVYQWTSLSIIKNVIAIILLVPVLFLLIKSYGIYGASWIWLILNFSYLIIEIPILHSRVLPKIQKIWYLHSILIPVFLVGFIGYALHFLFFQSSVFGFLEWMVIVLTMSGTLLLLNHIMSEQPLWSIRGLLKV
ncbi:MAG: oligosaccharide flippase family protein [Saprospiraceae bacterium]|nr:oligosaccharide flippase family protein [Saprospiraceae bacterium]